MKCPKCGNLSSFNIPYCVFCGNQFTFAQPLTAEKTVLYTPTNSSSDFNIPSLLVIENENIKHFVLDKYKGFAIGRNPEGYRSSIVLRSKLASRLHGEIVNTGSVCLYKDLGSANGTFVNGKKLIADRPVRLKDGDILKIGDSNHFDSRTVTMLYLSNCPTNVIWKMYRLSGRRTTNIGRNAGSCNIVLVSPHVSSVHAVIHFRNGSYYLKDMNSANGTWVGNNRIIGEYKLDENSVFALCDTKFIFTGTALIYSVPGRMSANPNALKPPMRSSTGGIGIRDDRKVILRANIQSKKVPNKNGRGSIELLRDVKVELKSSSLVALLGGSGAGKTTLMNCLNGSERDGVTGSVKYNNENLYGNYERLKHMIGSVPQSNVVHPDLKVERELSIAASIRLPSDTSSKEIKERVSKTIALLGLSHCSKSPIRTLSGGELKRVNIGIELVANRSLLCLDEPDAGLDPETKASLTKLLADLAHKENKTIIVIIHDVANIDLFDQVIFMTKLNNCGRLAFQGTPENARRYFGVKQLEQAYDILSKNPEKFVK